MVLIEYATGQKTGELWHLGGAVEDTGLWSAAHRTEDEWQGVGCDRGGWEEWC